MGIVTQGLDARLANQPFLILTLCHFGAQIERESAGKSKVKMVEEPAWRRIPELVWLFWEH